MCDVLFDFCCWFVDVYVDSSGVVVILVFGIILVWVLYSGDLQVVIVRLLVVMLFQGCKSVIIGLVSFDYGLGEVMVIVVDVFIISQIIEVSQCFFYYVLVLELDLVILCELQEVGLLGLDEVFCVGIELMNVDVMDVVYWLVRLFD